MDNGKCTECQSKCDWTEHKNLAFEWKKVEKEQTITNY